MDEQKPDLILTDIKMPIMDGYELYRKLKANLETHLIPVIIVSILADLEETANLGARAYIVKPFDPDKLLDEVKKVIGEKESVTDGHKENPGS